MPTRGWQFWYKSIRWPCLALDWRSFWRAVTSLVFSSMSRRIEVSFVWLFLIFECTTECTRGLGLPIEAAESSARAPTAFVSTWLPSPPRSSRGRCTSCWPFWTPPPSRPAWPPVRSFSVPPPSPPPQVPP